MERITAFNDELKLVNSRLRKEREKWKKRKVEYMDKFPVSGKIPKTPEMSKN